MVGGLVEGLVGDKVVGGLVSDSDGTKVRVVVPVVVGVVVAVVAGRVLAVVLGVEVNDADVIVVVAVVVSVEVAVVAVGASLGAEAGTPTTTCSPRPGVYGAAVGDRLGHTRPRNESPAVSVAMFIGSRTICEVAGSHDAIVK